MTASSVFNIKAILCVEIKFNDYTHKQHQSKAVRCLATSISSTPLIPYSTFLYPYLHAHSTHPHLLQNAWPIPGEGFRYPSTATPEQTTVPLHPCTNHPRHLIARMSGHIYKPIVINIINHSYCLLIANRYTHHTVVYTLAQCIQSSSITG